MEIKPEDLREGMILKLYRRLSSGLAPANSAFYMIGHCSAKHITYCFALPDEKVHSWSTPQQTSRKTFSGFLIVVI